MTEKRNEQEYINQKKNNVKQQEEKKPGYGNKKLEGPDFPAT
ncbi:hypothetical protein [Pseudalkalibacillus caeni]|nr:hypothetical protein [Pseudalkalibacillus caeni]